MKVYTLIIIEMGIIDVVKTFKTKKSAYECIRAEGYGEEVVEAIKDNGVWTGYTSEINLVANRMTEK